jgi:hypothetical protein
MFNPSSTCRNVRFSFGQQDWTVKSPRSQLVEGRGDV